MGGQSGEMAKTRQCGSARPSLRFRSRDCQNRAAADEFESTGQQRQSDHHFKARLRAKGGYPGSCDGQTQAEAHGITCSGGQAKTKTQGGFQAKGKTEAHAKALCGESGRFAFGDCQPQWNLRLRIAAGQRRQGYAHPPGTIVGNSKVTRKTGGRGMGFPYGRTR